MEGSLLPNLCIGTHFIARIDLTKRWDKKRPNMSQMKVIRHDWETNSTVIQNKEKLRRDDFSSI